MLSCHFIIWVTNWSSCKLTIVIRRNIVLSHSVFFYLFPVLKINRSQNSNARGRQTWGLREMNCKSDPVQFSWCGGQSALFRWIVCWDLDSLFICQKTTRWPVPRYSPAITNTHVSYLLLNKHLEELIRISMVSCSKLWNQCFMIMG